MVILQLHKKQLVGVVKVGVGGDPAAVGAFELIAAVLLPIGNNVPAGEAVPLPLGTAAEGRQRVFLAAGIQ